MLLLIFKYKPKYNKPKFIILNIVPEYCFVENIYVKMKSDTAINMLGSIKPSFDKLKFEFEMLPE